MKKLLAVSLLSFGISTAASADDLLATIATEDAYSTFASAVKSAGIEDSLKGNGPITVFAPNNEAFAKIPKAKLNKLLANKAELAKVLQYHIVASKVSNEDVAAGKIKTVEGHDLALSVTDGVKVNNARVIGTELHADNGAIHTVDTVLIPKKN
jgi:uncharacterized surface protein with fasciclin (FAS1) repeats